MLYLVGLGFEENDLSLRGFEIAKECECYCEFYTLEWQGSLERLKKIIGKEITTLQRSDIEEDLQKFLEKAKTKDIALLVPGDPLAATTHIDLVIEAKKQKIPVRIKHNASIFSAIAECGLQLYKFGRSATIPKTKQMQSVKDSVSMNKKNGLHTLLLIDIGLSAKEALQMLLEEKIVDKNEKIICASQLGTENTKIKYATAQALSDLDFPSPFVLVIPGKLHFREKEFLDLVR